MLTMDGLGCWAGPWLSLQLGKIFAYRKECNVYVCLLCATVRISCHFSSRFDIKGIFRYF